MRTGLTALAVLVILTLTAALVGPRLVDWGRQRAAVEAQLSRILGEPVKVGGPIDLDLLPSPYLTLGQVEIADPESGGFFSCDKMALELSLTSLARGQFRFTQASFDHPTIDLRRGPGGELLLPRLGLATRSDSIALEKVVVRDGRVRIKGGAEESRVEGIDLDAEANSLLGPFKGSGDALAFGGAKFAFHFATGVLEGAELHLKAAIEPEKGFERGEFDGALTFANATAMSGVAAMGYSGAAAFSGKISGGGAPTPWRASGVLEADLHAAALNNLEVRFGREDRELAASGSARAEFGPAPRASVTLAAKQLNLDALLRAEGEDSASPAQAYDNLSAVLAGLRLENGPPIALSFELQTPAAILGGDTIADVSLSATVNPGEPIDARLEASPPGRSHILASGAIDLGPALGFKGRVEAQTNEAQRLREWLSLRAPEVGARLSAIGDFLPYQSASATGEMDFSAAGFVARDLNLALERSAFTGTMALTRAVGVERGRLFMDLRTDSLDLDALPDVRANGDFFRDIDLSVTLDARSVRIARLGEGQVEGGSLALRLTKQGDDVRLERLSIAGLGGASLEASGAIDEKGRWLNAKIDAAKLRDFALLVRRVAPGPVSEILVDRSEELSPAKLILNAQSSGAAGDMAALPDSLSMEGAVGATRISAKLGHSESDASALSATLSLDAPDAAPLLRQLGLPAQSVSELGRGRVAASLHGRWGEVVEGELAATLGAADVAWRGRLSPQALGAGGALLVEGAGSIKSVNAAPLLAALGVTSRGLTLAVPTDISAQLTWRGDQLDLSQLKGVVGRAHFAGDLTYRPTPTQPIPSIPLDPDLTLAQALAAGDSATPATQPQLEGALSVDRLPLSALTGLALGPPQATTAKASWSDAKFTAGLADAPSADIALKVAALDLADNLVLVARDASARLKLGRSLVSLEDLAANVAGGAVAGHVTIRRSGPDASLAGQLSIDPLVLDRASFAGRLSGAMDFAATGQSPSALIGGLAGTGQIRLSGARIPRLDQAALGRIVEKAQSLDYPIDEVNISHALDVEFNKQTLRIPDADAPVSLTAGVMRFGPFDARNVTDEAKLDASFDMRSFALEIRAGFTELRTPKFWSGAPPAVNVVLKGPMEAPARQIDSSLLVAGLAAQAIARETERIAALESDIRERAFFNRRLKADQFMRRRELELESYSLEQARLKWDEDRRRVESETLKADEEKRKAATPEPSSTISPLANAPTPHDPLQSATSTFSAPVQPPLPAPRPPQQVDPAAGGLY